MPEPPDPAAWNDPLARRQFLKQSGSATAATLLAWHGMRVEVYASGSAGTLYKVAPDPDEDTDVPDPPTQSGNVEGNLIFEPTATEGPSESSGSIVVKIHGHGLDGGDEHNDWEWMNGVKELCTIELSCNSQTGAKTGSGSSGSEGNFTKILVDVEHTIGGEYRRYQMKAVGKVVVDEEFDRITVEVIGLKIQIWATIGLNPPVLQESVIVSPSETATLQIQER